MPDRALIEAQRLAAEAKAAFLADLSHQIRTPLTSVLGFASLLAEEASLSDTARRYVARVDSAAKALLATVNDALDVSRLEAGQIRLAPSPTDVRALCGELTELFDLQADEKGIALEVTCAADTPPLVLVDGGRLRQILTNLLGNALKFTDRGKVTLSLAPVRPGRLSAAVADTGSGIGEADLARLFERFSGVERGGSQRVGGAGLGLAICQSLAEAMDGKISVESRLGVGSTFTIEIAAPEADPAAQQAALASGAGPIDGVRVLVVDDNAANRELVRTTLSLLGAEPFEAESGPAAIALAGQQPVDVILMDINMPGMDGVETLRRIRAADGPNVGIPAYAFTADVMPERVAALKASGFDGHLAKPIEMEALLRAVAAASDSIVDGDDFRDVAGG